MLTATPTLDAHQSPDKLPASSPASTLSITPSSTPSSTPAGGHFDIVSECPAPTPTRTLAPSQIDPTTPAQPANRAGHAKHAKHTKHTKHTKHAERMRRRQYDLKWRRSSRVHALPRFLLAESRCVATPSGRGHHIYGLRAICEPGGGRTWLSLADVCAELGLSTPAVALRKHCRTEHPHVVRGDLEMPRRKASDPFTTIPGMVFISPTNYVRLVVRSRTPEAKARELTLSHEEWLRGWALPAGVPLEPMSKALHNQYLRQAQRRDAERQAQAQQEQAG